MWPATFCGGLPGIDTWGWLLLSITATTDSRRTGMKRMLGFGVNMALPGSDGELFRHITSLGRGALHLNERVVDHDVVAACVPFTDDHPVVSRRLGAAPRRLRSLGRRQHDLVGPGFKCLVISVTIWSSSDLSSRIHLELMKT